MAKLDIIKTLDDLPKNVKLILALPIIDIVWAVYRIIKGATGKQYKNLLLGVLWIIPGSFICWIIDLICIVKYGNIKLLA